MRSCLDHGSSLLTAQPPSALALNCHLFAKQQPDDPFKMQVESLITLLTTLKLDPHLTQDDLKFLQGLQGPT